VERNYSSCSFLTSTLDGVSGQRHAPAALYRGERTDCSHWVGDLVGLRVGLNKEVRGEIQCLCRGSNPSRLASSYTILTELLQLLENEDMKNNSFFHLEILGNI
jgi:hypothetical protein